jgi:beta-glucosidase
MATYPAVDGVPTHASEKLLTGLLRGELGFQGLVLSEGGGIGTLVYEGLAPDQKRAGQLALGAGVDVGISFESGYMLDMIASVREGKVDMALIDRAVRRILLQKMKLGLFEKASVDPDRAEKLVHSSEHQDLALRAARGGIVLLKNDKHVLPLRKDLKRIAVVGPNADDPLNQLGDYVASVVTQEVRTVLKGIRGTVSPGTTVDYVKGCDVTGTRVNEIQKARQAVASAEAAIVVVGENEWQKKDSQGTSGEGFDAATLELTGLQEELIEAVASTGTPTVVVLINGRPLAVRRAAERVPAIVEAWVGGEKGGRAVAEVLFGDHNPGGKSPVSFPRHAGQLPVYYNAKKSKAYWIEQGWGKPYVDMDPKPLFPFGHGLSYTTFEYSNLRTSSPTINRAGTVVVSADIKNVGSRAGEDVVQLYLEDVIGTVATPIKQLRGFVKVRLEPGQRKTVRFELSPDDLALYDRDLKRVVEPGEFRIFVGSSSEDIRLKGHFTVTE